jgi:hypothetical protein
MLLSKPYYWTIQMKNKTHFDTRDRWTANRCCRKLVDWGKRFELIIMTNEKNPFLVAQCCKDLCTWFVLRACSITLRTEANRV